MSKQLLLNFNQDGSLSQSQSTGSAIRQGDSNGEVTLVATFQNRRNDSYVAKLHFERPDGKKQRNIVMTPSASQSNQFDYSFLSGWFFAVAGTAKVTVTITDSNGAVSAQGSYSFAVEPTQVDVVDSTITYDEAAELEGLIANSIKRAKTVTLGQGVGVAGFYAACLSYLGDSAILDGDRFVGSTTNPQLNQSTKFFGEFVDDDKMLVIAKKRTYPTPASLTISHSVYVVSGGAQSPIVTEMVDSEKLSSLFDGTAAKKAISDQNGHVIDWTYATKAEVLAANNVGYIKIDDENEDENGNLTAAQVAEANKDVCFIQYTNGEGTMMFVSYYFGGTERYFWSFMTNTSEIGEPDGSPWAYRFRQARMILWGIDDPTSATWQFNEDDDVHVTHEPEQTSSDLITSGGVYNAVSALDAKISAVDDKVNYAIEAITKKDLYETQEATFQGMTAVPAGAMVKAYLDGFKGNSAVVNQLINKNYFQPSSKINGITFTNNGDGSWTLSGTATADANKQIGNISIINGHTYMIAGSPSGANQNTYSCYIDYLGHCNNTVVASSQTRIVPVKLFVPSGQTVNNVVFRLQVIDLSIVPLTSAEMADVATAKAVLKHKDMDVDSYIPYNAGTLTDSKPTKLYSRNAILASLPLKNIGAYTFTGQETWNASASDRYACAIINSLAKPANNAVVANFFVTGSGLTLSSKDGVVNGNGYIALGDGANIFLHDTVNVTSASQAASFMAGRTIYYELATPSPTISQAVIDGLVEHEYDLTMPYLKSAGSVQDESKAGGKLVNGIDLGTPNWADGPYENTIGSVYITGVVKKPSGNNVKANILCSKYVAAQWFGGTGAAYNTPNEISIDTSGYLYVNDSSLYGKTNEEIKTALTGVGFNYELATPTDFSDPISYPEIIDVEAGGSIEVVGEGCDATTKVYFYVEA